MGRTVQEKAEMRQLAPGVCERRNPPCSTNVLIRSKKHRLPIGDVVSCGRLLETKVIGNGSWLALDHDTQEIVGVAIGARDEATVRAVNTTYLWVHVNT
jgi:hypothetical protein